MHGLSLFCKNERVQLLNNLQGLTEFNKQFFKNFDLVMDGAQEGGVISSIYYDLSNHCVIRDYRNLKS